MGAKVSRLTTLAGVGLRDDLNEGRTDVEGFVDLRWRMRSPPVMVAPPVLRASARAFCMAL